MTKASPTPILGFAARSGTGKTTLLVKLLPILKALGLRIGMIKHAHHQFEVDKPGKDSYELRKAGANQVLVASSRRWVLMVENESEADPHLDQLVARLDNGTLDLILVEGFKRQPFPKIELYRPTLGNPALYTDDRSIIAVATDGKLPAPSALPILDINSPEEIAEFIQNRFLASRSAERS